MVRPLSVLFGLLMMCLSTGASALCEGRILFEDAFDDDLSGWISVPDHETIEGGQYFINPDKDGSFVSMVPTFFFDQSRICVELEFESPTEFSHDAGIAFWGEDFENYYTFQIGRSPAGAHELSVWRRVDGRWFRIFGAESEDFEVGPGITNTLHVDIDGAIVNAYVNRVPVIRFRAQPPELKHRVGVFAQVDRQGGSVAFNLIRVTIPEI